MRVLLTVCAKTLNTLWPHRRDHAQSAQSQLHSCVCVVSDGQKTFHRRGEHSSSMGLSNEE